MRAIAQLLIIAFVAPGFAQADQAEDIAQAVKSHFERGKIHGSVLVAQKGAVIYEGAVGMANYEWEIPNAPDTKHRLGSITKQFTAVLILQLMEQGKLNPEDTILDHLPDYREDTGGTITIHHLLTHTSGLPNYTANPTFFPEYSRDYFSVEDFVPEFCSGDLEFEPGEKMKYSNSGYFLLGAIIEAATGDTYQKALRAMLDSVSMHDTGYDLHETILLKRATGYERNGDDLVNSKYLDMSIPYAAGSMYSTVRDMHKWDRALYTNELLTDDSKKRMYTNHKSNYGYGWSVRDVKLKESKTGRDAVFTIGHGGGINGFNTGISREPENEYVIVVLNNASPSPATGLIRDIYNILFAK